MRQKAREMKRLTSKLWNNPYPGGLGFWNRMAEYKSVPDRFRCDVRSSAMAVARRVCRRHDRVSRCRRL
jgi:hypothetical protein